MSGLLMPHELRDALVGFCDTIERHRDRQRAWSEFNAISSRFELGVQRLLDRLNGLVRRLRDLEATPPYQLARAAVVAAADLATLTDAERRLDMADAVARRDVTRALEHRLAMPGVDADLAALRAMEGDEAVDRTLLDVHQIANARALLADFRGRLHEFGDPWPRVGPFENLRASFAADLEPMVDAFWPSWCTTWQVAA